MDLNELTFTVKLKVVRIYYDDGNIEPLQASIGGMVLSMAENRWNPKMIKYESDVIDYRKKYSLQFVVRKDAVSSYICSDIIGGIFAGVYDVNDNAVCLTLCGLPSKRQVGKYVDGLQVEFILDIKECDLTYHNVATFKYGHYPHVISDTYVILSTFDMNDYDDLDEFTFSMKIEILHEIAMDGSIIGDNIDNDWDELILNDGSKNNLENMNIDKEHQKNELKTKRNKENELFRDWLKKINLETYCDILEKNGFDDFDAIFTVSLEQLNEIGITKIGHRQKLMKHINDKQKERDSWLFALFNFFQIFFEGS